LCQHINVPTKNKRTKAIVFLFTQIYELFHYNANHRLIFSFSTKILPMTDEDGHFRPIFYLFNIPLAFYCWAEYHLYQKFVLFPQLF
jgi:hypothetical protein